MHPRETRVGGVYRDGKIEVGLIGPGISSKETADAVAHHYGFPHYG